jgi:hypothetical protein
MPFITQGKTNVKYLTIVVVLAILAGAGIFLCRQYLDRKAAEIFTQNQGACTQEAKICPDGSSVGRTGPNCEFAACAVGTAGWKTYSSEEHGFEIKYPLDFTEQQAEFDGISLIKTDSGSSYYLRIGVDKNYKIPSGVAEVKEINIGGHPGYKYFYTEGAGMSGVASIQMGQGALNISFDHIGGGQKFATVNDREAYVQNFFDQILSTVKFKEEAL